MLGLDLVKGPHWCQILSLFGLKGTLSTVLKHRTQVQLKDKARNLKLFFLKNHSEVPFYLKSVTGELKPRAPTQAARKEAEANARTNSAEDQAKVEGILALANGLRDRSSQEFTPVPSAYATATTPASAWPPTLGSPATLGHGRGAVDRTGKKPLGGLPQLQPAPAPSLDSAQANQVRVRTSAVPQVQSETQQQHYLTAQGLPAGQRQTLSPMLSRPLPSTAYASQPQPQHTDQNPYPPASHITNQPTSSVSLDHESLTYQLAHQPSSYSSVSDSTTATADSHQPWSHRPAPRSDSSDTRLQSSVISVDEEAIVNRIRQALQACYGSPLSLPRSSNKP